MGEYLSITEAARSLGISEPTLRAWVRQGSLTAATGPRGTQIAWSEVVRLLADRREQALAREHGTITDTATAVADQLWPWVETEHANARGRIAFTRTRSTDADKARAAHDRLPDSAAAIFGHASVAAAARPLTDGCRWCAARTLADHFRTFGPADRPEYRALFNSEPCDADRRAFERQDRFSRRIRREQAVTTAGRDLRLAALALAELKIGAPYRLNASGPTAFDCSGLVQWAYMQAGGVDVPRTRTALHDLSVRVPVEDAEPGDLLFADGSPSHVAIFAGDGKVIHAGEDGVTHVPMTVRAWTTALRLGVAT